jgi:hypothetical protein
MLIYLDNAMTELRAERDAGQQPFTRDDLHAAIMTGAVERMRPKMMTVAAIGRTPAHHVESRHRRRGDAAHRRADDRRHGVLDPADLDRNSRDLCGGEGRSDAIAAARAVAAADMIDGDRFMMHDMMDMMGGMGWAWDLSG